MGNRLVEEIKNRANIVDVIGGYVDLKRAGVNHKGLCPFHNEKTPSFVVSEDKQSFHCYGCGEGGDVISFVQKKENLDFHTALAKLAEMYGISMEEYGFRDESRKNKIYELNREAARFYFNNLKEEGNPGLEYMLGRGLDYRTMARFGMGYAKDSFNDLTDYLRSKGYSNEEMYTAGLASRSDKPGKDGKPRIRYFDKFRNRVMFPIFNTRGKVIGFGGRDLGDRGPKYLNSPESPVFSKKDNLYGLNLTRNDISKEDCVIVVEGYMDLVSLYKHGITNVAASLGTALTEQQCRLLGRYTKNVILSYDADAAGRKAALRGIDLLHAAGMKSRVLHVTDGKDPDEFVRKNGEAAFRSLLKKALPYGDYKIADIRGRYDISTAEGTIDFIKAVNDSVLSRMDEVEADVYIRKLAAETGINEGAIRKESNANRSGDGASGRRPADGQRKPAGQGSGAPGMPQAADMGQSGDNSGGDSNIKLERTFIKLLFQDPQYMEEVRGFERVFVDGIYFTIYNAMCEEYAAGGTIEVTAVKERLEQEHVDVIDNILANEVFLKDARTVMDDCTAVIRKNELEATIRDINARLDLVDDTEFKNMYEELNRCQKEIQSIKTSRGWQ